MGRLKATLLALCLAALAATALSACGEESADLLPGETAREINANLDLVEQLVAEQDCVGAANAAAAVSGQVEGLGGVDQELKDALTKAANKLEEVVTECDETSEEETIPSTEADQELEEEERAKEEEAAQKEAEKEQKKEEKEKEKELPPAESPDQEKEEGETPPTESEDGGTPSGGVSPSTPVEGE